MDYETDTNTIQMAVTLFHLFGERCKTETRYNHNHDPETGKFISSSLTSDVESSIIKTGNSKLPTDSKGKPYKYPAVQLEPKEYGKVMHEINTVYYSRFKGKRVADIVIAFEYGYNYYEFEIHDFNEYNIFCKKGD